MIMKLPPMLFGRQRPPATISSLNFQLFSFLICIIPAIVVSFTTPISRYNTNLIKSYPFSTSTSSPPTPIHKTAQSRLYASAGIDEYNDNENCKRSETIPREDLHPLITFGTGDKEKIVNAYGGFFALSSLITCSIWLLAMNTLQMIYKINDDFDPDRAIYDYSGKIWSRALLRMTGSYPTLTGNLDCIKEHSGACLFVANHASWLDIPVICTVLDPVFKFIAKGELENLPCIGHQLKGGHHILINRDDRRSQLRTFKEGITWLKKGVPIMAFPEGQRSKDGRLMDFKGGLFSMAIKCNVPIIPITISNTHAVMPSYSLFPVQPGAGKLKVHVHSPIDTIGKSDAELLELVREAIISKLPVDQRPVPSIDEIIGDVIQDEADQMKQKNKLQMSS